MTSSPAAVSHVVTLLERERAAFLAQVERVPAGRRGERPAPDRWSAAEIIEHVARVDLGISRLLELRAAEPLATPAEELAAAELTPERIGWVRERATRVQAPDRVRPTGTVDAVAALELLATARARLTSAFLGTDAAILDGTAHPHPFLGPMTLRGWVEFAAHHEARHAMQLGEVAEAWRAGGPSPG